MLSDVSSCLIWVILLTMGNSRVFWVMQCVHMCTSSAMCTNFWQRVFWLLGRKIQVIVALSVFKKIYSEIEEYSWAELPPPPCCLLNYFRCRTTDKELSTFCPLTTLPHFLPFSAGPSLYICLFSEDNSFNTCWNLVAERSKLKWAHFNQRNLRGSWLAKSPLVE